MEKRETQGHMGRGVKNRAIGLAGAKGDIGPQGLKGIKGERGETEQAGNVRQKSEPGKNVGQNCD